MTPLPSIKAVWPTVLWLVRFTAGVLAIWVIGFLLFVGALPRQVDDVTRHTDAIIVLTGGRDRLKTGLDLWQDQKADYLFISGVARGVDWDDVVRQTTGHPAGQVDPRIMLGHRAGDTVGNAVESAAWVQSMHIGSVRLVTGAYHMPRALLEFRHMLPDTILIPHPVFPEAVKSREWWRWPGTAYLLATEYTKTLVAMVRHWIVPVGRSEP